MMAFQVSIREIGEMVGANSQSLVSFSTLSLNDCSNFSWKVCMYVHKEPLTVSGVTTLDHKPLSHALTTVNSTLDSSELYVSLDATLSREVAFFIVYRGVCDNMANVFDNMAYGCEVRFSVGRVPLSRMFGWN